MGRDRACALVLLAFGLGGAWEAYRLTIGGPNRPGPGFVPFWLGLAIAVVAAALLIRPAPAARAASAPPAPAAPAAGDEPRGRLRYGRVGLTLAAGLVYAFALEPVGFLATTFGFLLFMLRGIEERGWPSSLTIAAATALASHLLFRVWLGVQLPGGPWGF